MVEDVIKFPRIGTIAMHQVGKPPGEVMVDMIIRRHADGVSIVGGRQRQFQRVAADVLSGRMPSARTAVFGSALDPVAMRVLMPLCHDDSHLSKKKPL